MMLIRVDLRILVLIVFGLGSEGREIVGSYLCGGLVEMLDGIGVVLTKLLEKGQFFEELAAD